jgi:hypothetical protein
MSLLTIGEQITVLVVRSLLSELIAWIEMSYPLRLDKRFYVSKEFGYNLSLSE